MKLTAAILFLFLCSLPAYACCAGGNGSAPTECNKSGENPADNSAAGENYSSGIVMEGLSDCGSTDEHVTVNVNSTESCSCAGLCLCGCCPTTVSYSLSSLQFIQYNSMHFAPFSTGLFTNSLSPAVIPPECGSAV